MIDRKKKLRRIQISLLAIGLIIIFFTYYKKETSLKESIIPKATLEKIEADYITAATEKGLL